MKTKKRNYKLSFFLYFLIFGILIELITVGIVFTINYYDMLDELDTKFKTQNSIKINMLKDTTQSVQSSINSIKDNQIFINYLQNPSKENKKLALDLFFYISSENKSYMQVRYIDKNGFERLRLDKNEKQDEKPIIIKDENLQNKSDRYYFTQSMQMQKHGFWYSNLDLNIENNKIQIPYAPTLRIAKQVFNNGEEKGIIIINILMENFLKKLIKSSIFNISIIDNKGNFIYSYDSKNSWAIDLKTNKKIDDIENIKFDKNIFSHKYSYFVNISEYIKSPQKLYLVFNKKHEIIAKLKKQNAYVALWIIFLVLVVSVPIAYLISGIPLTLQRKLKLALEELQKTSNIVDKFVMILTVSKDGMIKSASNAFCNRTYYDCDELIGKDYFSLINNNSKENNILKNTELKILSKENKLFHVEQTVTPPKKDDISGDYTLILVDITEKKQIELKSITDPLTKLYNRGGIDKYLKREMRLSKRHKNDLAMIIVDIDFFKNINDTFGHQIGDDVLKQLANILKKHTRKTDIVGRFGGEEFIIILPQTYKNGAISLANQLREKIQNHNFGIKLNITASFGVSSYQDQDDIKSLIQRADEALYRAKQSGRNKVC